VSTTSIVRRTMCTDLMIYIPYIKFVITFKRVFVRRMYAHDLYIYKIFLAQL
jgi:hypothetical protein